MSFSLIPSVAEAAARHARACYPNESCGLVVGDAYWACENVAEDPAESFKIPSQVYLQALQTGDLRALVHSHPSTATSESGPEPSEADMRAQMLGKVPWVIVPLDEERVHAPTVFGDELGIAPLIGRTFLHGVHDCFAIVRDVHRLGRDALAEQDIEWPHPPIEVANVPRDPDWWKHEDKDLYRDGFGPAGFVEIDRTEARPGDVFLAVVPGTHNPHKRLCHGGVLLASNLLLHHLPGRLSRREAAGNWLRAIHVWVRHQSVHEA